MSSKLEFGIAFKPIDNGLDSYVKSVKASLNGIGDSAAGIGDKSTVGVRQLIEAFAQSKRAAAGLHEQFTAATSAVAAVAAKLKTNPGDESLAKEFDKVKRAAGAAKEEFLQGNVVTEMVRRKLAEQGLSVANLAEDYRQLKLAAQLPNIAPNAAISRQAATGISTPAAIEQPNVHQLGNVQSLDGVAGRIEEISGKLSRMGHLASTVFVAQYISNYAAELGRMSDSYTKMNAQLNLSVQGAGKFAQAQEDVLRIAANAATGLAETAQLYSRLSASVTRLGFDQQHVADITETVALSLKISGATAAESSSAILQLSQAFGSGVLRGEEFNAVNESSPRLMQALADAIGKPKEELRGLAEQGLLSSRLLAKALPQALAQLKAEAATMPLTIGQSFTLLNNQMTLLVGKFNQGTGVFSGFASGVKLLADNIAVALTLAGTAGAVMAVKITQGIVTKRAVERAAHIAVLEEIAARHAAESAANQAALTGLARLGVARAETTAAAIAGDTAMAASAGRTALAMRGLLTFLTGPVGIVISLGLAATAWVGFGEKAETTLDAAIRKTKELKAAQEKTGIKAAPQDSEAVQQLAEYEQLLEGKRAVFAEAQAKLNADTQNGVSLTRLLFGQDALEVGRLREQVKLAEAEVDKARAALQAKKTEPAVKIETASAWDKLHQTQAEQRAQDLKELDDGYKKEIALSGQSQDQLLALTATYQKRRAELLQKNTREDHTQSEPLISDTEKMQLEQARLAIENLGFSSASAADQVKVYEAALKSAHAVERLRTQGHADQAAKLEAQNKTELEALQLATDATIKMREAALAQEVLNKATADAAQFIDKMNQFASQANADLEFRTMLEGKSAVETARLTAERKAQLEVDQEIWSLMQKYKDDIPARDAAVQQVALAAPGMVQQAGQAGAEGAMQKGVEQIGALDQGKTENDRYANELEAYQTYAAQHEGEVIKNAQIIESIKQQHEAKLLQLGLAGHLSAQQYDKAATLTKFNIIAGGMQNLLGAAASHSRAAFNINKAFHLAEAIPAAHAAVVKAYNWGATWGGPPGGVIAGAAAAASQFAVIKSIASSDFGGSSSAPSVGGAAGGVAIASPSYAAPAALPAPTQIAPAKQDINLSIAGLATLRAGDLVDVTMVRDQLIPEIIAGLKDGVAGANINLVYS